MTKIDIKPIVFEDPSTVKKIINKHQDIYVNDAFERQIKELFFIDNLQFIGQDKTEVCKSPEFNKYRNKKKDDFLYVYYPWNYSLVKCVKEADYFRLKTNRNQDLITAEEQKRLRDYKVAVFGMSVGSNIAFVLTQSGISKNITIADFDELDTTNLNRIWAGVYQVGLNKCVIAARRIYEDNPYAKVSALTKGISSPQLENLLKSKKIDCIVEEIDNMLLKIEIRKLAIKYKTPVLMVTDNGDWAVLHIERYDLGYKKFFEKDVDYWRKRLRQYDPRKDFADIVINQIVGGPDKVDSRMLLSANKVKTSFVAAIGKRCSFGGYCSNGCNKKDCAGRKSGKVY